MTERAAAPAPDGAPADEAWAFVCRVYDVAGIAPACLALQDRHGIDVSLLLFALWAGLAYGRRFDADELARLDAVATPWQSEVVAPLRALRRRLRTGPATIPEPERAARRSELLALELACERTELRTLVAAVGGRPGGPTGTGGAAAAAANLAAVAGRAGADAQPVIAALIAAGRDAQAAFGRTESVG